MRCFNLSSTDCRNIVLDGLENRIVTKKHCLLCISLLESILKLVKWIGALLTIKIGFNKFR